MANFIGTARTNYFHVTDEEKYKYLFNGLVGSDDEIISFDETDKNGKILHGFGSYGSIYWSPSKADGNPDWLDEDDTDGYEDFLNQLSKILPKDEAFVLIDVGHEKLRYLSGFATIVTNKDIKYVDLTNTAQTVAQEMLRKPNYKLEIEY